MADTRTALIQATRDTIRDSGMSSATARAITGRAGANLAAIPYHFGSKDVLVAEALVAEARDLVAPVLDLLAADAPGPQRAAQAVGALTTLLDQHRDRVPVYLAAVAAAPHDPAVRSALAEMWTELTHHLAEDIAIQRDEGLLPGWVQPDAMAALIVAVVNGVVVGDAVGADTADHRAVAAQFLALLLEAGRRS